MNGDIGDDITGGDGSDHAPDPLPEPGTHDGMDHLTSQSDHAPQDEPDAAPWPGDGDLSEPLDGGVTDGDVTDGDPADLDMFDPQNQLGAETGWADAADSESVDETDWRPADVEESWRPAETPPMLTQLWGDAIGTGAVDPTGVEPAFFADLEAPEFGGLAPDEPDLDWLAAADVDVENWAQPDLLDSVEAAAMSTTDGLIGADADGGTASVVGLWERLSPGQEMPMTETGVPDLTVILGELAERAGDSPLRDVVDAARRLTGG